MVEPRLLLRFLRGLHSRVYDRERRLLPALAFGNINFMRGYGWWPEGSHHCLRGLPTWRKLVIDGINYSSNGDAKLADRLYHHTREAPYVSNSAPLTYHSHAVHRRYTAAMRMR